MRVIEKTLYLFHELPTEKAKENARAWCRDGLEYSWGRESRESIEAFCDHFGVLLQGYRVDPWRYSYAHNAENANFRGMKLSEFSPDHMPTGYCLDYDLWSTFHSEFKKTGSALLAFDAALDAGFRAWRDDMAWQESDEYIDEIIEANEYEFDENGSKA